MIRLNEKSGDQQSHEDLSSGHNKCLYQLLWQAIKRLLRYTVSVWIKASGHPKSHATCLAKNQESDWTDENVSVLANSATFRH